MSHQQPWEKRIGRQREWVWRGWPIRYTYLPGREEHLKDPKPPLILLHGFGAAIEHWRHNIPCLSQHYRVYALDLLGFGGQKRQQRIIVFIFGLNKSMIFGRLLSVNLLF